MGARSGDAVGPLLSWQDQRTAPHCARLRREGAGDRVRALSGLPVDPMFSAPKATWLLDAHDPDRARSRRGELCLGTVDSWLLSRLGGEHVIEAGNASRTQLLDVKTCRWHPELLELFGIPESAADRGLVGGGPARPCMPPLQDGTPVLAVMGDSHAALFAHAGWRPGQGDLRHRLVDHEPRPPPRPGIGGAVRHDRVGRRTPQPAVEGNIRASGATLTWLAAVLETSPEALAERAAPSSDGVHLVPAFGGLGAPWWDDEAVGLISDLTFGTRTPHLARAALESIAFQVEDVVAAVDREIAPVRSCSPTVGPPPTASAQLQADTGGRRVRVARSREPRRSASRTSRPGRRPVGPRDVEALDRAGDVYTRQRRSRRRRVAVARRSRARTRTGRHEEPRTRA